MIGYLVGSNFGRGFPEYVRNFNANFLALPALPSHLVERVSSDPYVVVREIRTARHGTWYAIVNTDMHPVTDVTIRLPGNGRLENAVTRESIAQSGGSVTTSLYPFQLLTWHSPANSIDSTR